jgi:hypothetical protein
MEEVNPSPQFQFWENCSKIGPEAQAGIRHPGEGNLRPFSFY